LHQNNPEKHGLLRFLLFVCLNSLPLRFAVYHIGTFAVMLFLTWVFVKKAQISNKRSFLKPEIIDNGIMLQENN
jgi:hypothetical protein